MSGIDRLRTLAGAWDEWGLGGTLADVADQIERELREALKSDASDVGEGEKPSCATTPDAADATSGAQKVTREGAEAIAWVSEHGGLDHVREEWDRRSNLKRTCEKLRAKVERQQSHIELVQGKCKTRVHRIVELHKTIAEMRPRLMPEDMEWPRYTSGEPVEVGDDVVGPDYGERIHVDAVKFHANGFTLYDKNGFDKWYESDERFERPAVLAADGRPLREGETVWDVLGNRRFKVLGIEPCPGHEEYAVKTVGIDGMSLGGWSKPSDLTHERPDSWERIEKDAENVAKIFDNFDADASEDIRAIVRRCRALAERERGE